MGSIKLGPASSAYPYLRVNCSSSILPLFTKDTVSVLRSRLVEEGLPVIHCPSHILPIHVGDPVMSTKAMYDLRHRWNIYIQAINYPTVKYGEERLRIAPSPFHDQDMMDYFVSAIKVVLIPPCRESETFS